MKTQKRIGLRFFITYLCVVLPFLMMSVMIHSLSMHQMRQDARAQLTARLGRVISGMENTPASAIRKNAGTAEKKVAI